MTMSHDEAILEPGVAVMVGVDIEAEIGHYTGILVRLCIT